MCACCSQFDSVVSLDRMQYVLYAYIVSARDSYMCTCNQPPKVLLMHPGGNVLLKSFFRLQCAAALRLYQTVVPHNSKHMFLTPWTESQFGMMPENYMFAAPPGLGGECF